jgi:hypothetical protein
MNSFVKLFDFGLTTAITLTFASCSSSAKFTQSEYNNFIKDSDGRTFHEAYDSLKLFDLPETKNHRSAKVHGSDEPKFSDTSNYFNVEIPLNAKDKVSCTIFKKNGIDFADYAKDIVLKAEEVADYYPGKIEVSSFESSPYFLITTFWKNSENHIANKLKVFVVMLNRHFANCTYTGLGEDKTFLKVAHEVLPYLNFRDDTDPTGRIEILKTHYKSDTVGFTKSSFTKEENRTSELILKSSLTLNKDFELTAESQENSSIFLDNHITEGSYFGYRNHGWVYRENLQTVGNKTIVDGRLEGRNVHELLTHSGSYESLENIRKKILSSFIRPKISESKSLETVRFSPTNNMFILKNNFSFLRKSAKLTILSRDNLEVFYNDDGVQVKALGEQSSDGTTAELIYSNL